MGIKFTLSPCLAMVVRDIPHDYLSGKVGVDAPGCQCLGWFRLLRCGVYCAGEHSLLHAGTKARFPSWQFTWVGSRQSVLFMSPCSLTMLIIDCQSHMCDFEHCAYALDSLSDPLGHYVASLRDHLCCAQLSLQDLRIKAGAGSSYLGTGIRGEKLSKPSVTLIKGL